MTTTTAQRESLQRVGLGVLEACEAAGAGGAAGGILFAAMQAQGASLNQFNSFMTTFTSNKLLTVENECYSITAEGRTFMAALQKKFGPTAV